MSAGRPVHMVYATWSEGYRPGGINRRGTLPPYVSDFLTNWEVGWKTSWADNSVIWNGAVFQEDWDNFQFSLLGLNGLTDIRNANAARIRVLETDLTWAATYNLASVAALRSTTRSSPRTIAAKLKKTARCTTSVRPT